MPRLIWLRVSHYWLGRSILDAKRVVVHLLPLFSSFGTALMPGPSTLSKDMDIVFDQQDVNATDSTTDVRFLRMYGAAAQASTPLVFARSRASGGCN